MIGTVSSLYLNVISSYHLAAHQHPTQYSLPLTDERVVQLWLELLQPFLAGIEVAVVRALLPFVVLRQAPNNECKPTHSSRQLPYRIYRVVRGSGFSPQSRQNRPEA